MVQIRRNANLSTGGTAIDVTELVHPEVAARAVEAAKVIGLDIAGIDIVASDIARPLEAQGGIVVEVNAAPGLRMHLAPSTGEPRPVGEAICRHDVPARGQRPHPDCGGHGYERKDHGDPLPGARPARQPARRSA